MRRTPDAARECIVSHQVPAATPSRKVLLNKRVTKLSHCSREEVAELAEYSAWGWRLFKALEDDGSYEDATLNRVRNDVRAMCRA